MLTLVIENVPASLFDRIQDLAKTQHQTPAEAVLEVLESALGKAPTISESPMPQEPFLTEEICAPCSIPWPEGKPVLAVHVDAPLPTPHDLPEED